MPRIWRGILRTGICLRLHPRRRSKLPEGNPVSLDRATVPVIAKLKKARQWRAFSVA